MPETIHAFGVYEISKTVYAFDVFPDICAYDMCIGRQNVKFKMVSKKPF